MADVIKITRCLTVDHATGYERFAEYVGKHRKGSVLLRNGDTLTMVKALKSKSKGRFVGVVVGPGVLLVRGQTEGAYDRYRRAVDEESLLQRAMAL